MVNPLAVYNVALVIWRGVLIEECATHLTQADVTTFIRAASGGVVTSHIPSNALPVFLDSRLVSRRETGQTRLTGLAGRTGRTGLTGLTGESSLDTPAPSYNTFFTISYEHTATLSIVDSIYVAAGKVCAWHGT